MFFGQFFSKAGGFLNLLTTPYSMLPLYVLLIFLEVRMNYFVFKSDILPRFEELNPCDPLLYSTSICTFGAVIFTLYYLYY